jgi:hypothetical protein
MSDVIYHEHMPGAEMRNGKKHEERAGFRAFNPSLSTESDQDPI